MPINDFFPPLKYSNCSKNYQVGFSLIEVMVTCAITAILVYFSGNMISDFMKVERNATRVSETDRESLSAIGALKRPQNLAVVFDSYKQINGQALSNCIREIGTNCNSMFSSKSEIPFNEGIKKFFGPQEKWSANIGTKVVIKLYGSMDCSQTACTQFKLSHEITTQDSAGKEISKKFSTANSVSVFTINKLSSDLGNGCWLGSNGQALAVSGMSLLHTSTNCSPPSITQDCTGAPLRSISAVNSGACVSIVKANCARDSRLPGLVEVGLVYGSDNCSQSSVTTTTISYP